MDLVVVGQSLPVADLLLTRRCKQQLFLKCVVFHAAHVCQIPQVLLLAEAGCRLGVTGR